MPEYETYDPQKHGRDTPQSVFGPVVKVDKHDDGKIHVIPLNRPHRLNSIGDGLGVTLTVVDYHEHSVGQGSDAMAASYIEAATPDGARVYGVGMDKDIVTASMKAAISAANRVAR